VSKVRKTPLQSGRQRATIITREKERAIFTNIRPQVIKSVDTGAFPGAGTFFCVGCGNHLSLLEEDVLPTCPACGGRAFGRDSIFESMQDHGGLTSEFTVRDEAGAPDWLDEARSMLDAGARALATRPDDGSIELFPLEAGWTRIGRSAAADIRLDDPSVSRRHALVVSEKPKALRVLDDRSLNGVRLNGVQIEWSRLADGDELAVGRYRLFVLER
jgi:hypothetical protein